VSVLKLSEVLAMLDSVQSFRTFAPPSFLDEQVPDAEVVVVKVGGAVSCRGRVAPGEGMLGHRREEALKEDLFQFFNFERLSAWVRGDATTEVYMVRGLEFRGDVMLRLQSRG